jgi:hypothetical protein
MWMHKESPYSIDGIAKETLWNQGGFLNMGVIGGAVPASAPSCTTSNDSQLVAFSTNSETYVPVSTTDWPAQVFTSPAGGTWTLTEYSLNLSYAGGADKTFTASLWTTDANHKPVSEISGTSASVTIGDAGEHQLTLVTPKTGLAAATEFACVLKSDSTGAWSRSSAIFGGIAGQYETATSDSGVNWDTPYNDRALSGNGIYGCQ